MIEYRIIAFNFEFHLRNTIKFLQINYESINQNIWNIERSVLEKD